jgi:hypothetical protein
MPASIDYLLENLLDAAKPYTVAVYGSDPTAAGSLENDDLWYSPDFVTYAEAFAYYTQEAITSPESWILLVGPCGVANECGFLQMLEPCSVSAAKSAEWYDDGSEAAMLAGMADGCDAYNTACGY